MSAPPPYAPTTTSSYAPATENSHVNFHEEISRASIIPTSIHKAVYDALGELYSILTVTQMVEAAFIKDFILDKEKYTATVMRLVNQSQILRESFRASPTHEQIVSEILPGLDQNHTNLLAELAAKFNLHAPLAVDRLSKGVPATIEHFHKHVERADSAPAANSVAPNASGAGPALSGASKSSAASARLVAEATGNFITLMDAVKLNYNTKPQLHPLLSNLVLSLNEMVTRENTRAVTHEFPGKSKLVSWLIKLNNLAEDDVLSADDSEVFLQDLDESYRGFYDSLE
ncbi:hypothetical protein JCM33374_g4737 [Metschnikowia sp. JCM 33374]|nr:hypothetical protein JCM33374_g4737 [Metschnikowia sp. JCM 33374]